MGSRLRGNDEDEGGNDAFLVAPAEAGVHASKQEWILAFAESTPRIEKKYSGGNDGTPVRTETDGVCCMQW
jgi:hypothetical protein